MLSPAWLKDLKQSKIRVRVTTSNVSTRKVAGLDDILTFKWQFSMNGQTISAEQFKNLWMRNVNLFVLVLNGSE